MGSDAPAPVIIQKKPEITPLTENLNKTVSSVIFKPHNQGSTLEKQDEKVGFEIDFIRNSQLRNRERERAYSEVAYEEIRASMPIKEDPRMLHRESLPIERIIFNKQEEKEEEERQAERMKFSMQFQQMLMLQQSRSKDKQQAQKEYQLTLALDENWLMGLKNREKEKIDFEKAYQRMDKQSQRDSIIQMMTKYKRVGYGGRKIQMLFRQHVPRGAIYFFEVQLISYIPKYKFEFTVGVVDYFKAQHNIHSRDCSIEQSFTLKEKRNTSISKEEENKPLRLNKTIRVEVSRVKGNAFLAVFVNREQVYRENLRQQMLEQLTVAPYIQTQFQGVEFGWKNPTFIS